MPPKSKKEQELLERLDSMFRSALDKPAWKNWRAEAVEDFEFREGKQWTDKELKELENRGQPDTVENQIAVFLKRLKGQYERNRQRIAYRGRNPGADEQTADALSHFVLFVQQNNDFEFEESDMADDGFVSGFGVLWCDMDMSNPVEPEIRIRREDCFNVFPDPYSTRYDWNEDARFIIKSKWMEVEEAYALWPDKKKQIKQMINEWVQPETSAADALQDNVYYDSNYDRVRPSEIWYKEKEDATRVIYPDGSYDDYWVKPKDLTEEDRADTARGGGQITEIKKDRIYVCVVLGDVLLEGPKSPYDHSLFPAIPFYYNRKKSGQPYGLVNELKSIQREINKRRSKALHLLVENQIILPKESVEDLDDLAEQKARPDGIITYRYRQGYPEPQLIKNTDLGAAQMGMHDSSNVSLRQISGINPDAMGEKSEVRSGIGIARKQAMTDLITMPVFNNLRRTRKILGSLILEYVKEFYTPGKVFKITDSQKVTRMWELNTDILRNYKYDVIVEDAPDYTTMQEEQFAVLANLLPQVAPFGPGLMTMMLQMSHLKNKDDIIPQIQQLMEPPPEQPKMSVSFNWEEMPPEEKAMIAVNARWLDLEQASQVFKVDSKSIMKAKTDLKKTAMKVSADIDRADMDAALEVEKLKVEKLKTTQDKKVAKKD